jgi:hypothetical protein
LITHRISAEDCQARQRSHFHKCHRCVYRGKASDWVCEAARPHKAPAGAPAANGVAKAGKAKAAEAAVVAPVAAAKGEAQA